jgi:hypothetical protein
MRAGMMLGEGKEMTLREYKWMLRRLADRLGSASVVLLHALEDVQSAEMLAAHLSPAARALVISVWHLGWIDPGDSIECVVRRRLGDSDIVCVLQSAELYSDTWQWALAAAAARAALLHARVIPIRLRPVLESHGPFRALMPLPVLPVVIATLPSEQREAEWARIAHHIVRVAGKVADGYLHDIAGRLRDAPCELRVSFRRVAIAFDRGDLPDDDWVALTYAVHDGDARCPVTGRQAVRELLSTFLAEAE